MAAALDAVRPRLGAIASDVHYFATTSSTNDRAIELAAGGLVGLVVLADAQTAGRGRRGHAWFSPPESGLYVSIVLAPGRARVEPDRATMLLTIASGVAIAEGIQAATGLGVDVKWPNDLYVGRRKLAGILAEASISPDGPVVLGYGINVQSTAYPPELRDRATSLELELGRPIDRMLVFAETLAAVASRYADLLDGRYDAILDAWRRRAPGASGAQVSWATRDVRQTGVTCGIDADGALLVRVGGRIDRIVSGEVQWDGGR